MENEAERVAVLIAAEEDAKNKSVFAAMAARFKKVEDVIASLKAEQDRLSKELNNSVTSVNDSIKSVGDNISSNITEKIKSAAKIWAVSFSAKKGFNFIQQTSDQIIRLSSESKKYFGFTLSEYQGIENFFKKSGINNEKYFNQIDRYLRTTKQYSLGTKKGLLQLSNAFAKMDAKTRNAYASQYRLSNDFVDFIATNNQKIESALKDNKSWFFTEADVKVAKDFKTALEEIGNEVFGLFKPVVMTGMKATTYFINQISDAVKDLHESMQNLIGDSFANFEKFFTKTLPDILTVLAPIMMTFSKHKWMRRLGTFGTMLVVGEDILKGIAGKDSVSKRLYDLYSSSKNSKTENTPIISLSAFPKLKGTFVEEIFRSNQSGLEKISTQVAEDLFAELIKTAVAEPKGIPVEEIYRNAQNRYSKTDTELAEDLVAKRFAERVEASVHAGEEAERNIIRNENNFSININADEKTGKEIVQELMKAVEIRMPSNLGGAVVQ